MRSPGRGSSDRYTARGARVRHVGRARRGLRVRGARTAMHANRPVRGGMAPGGWRPRTIRRGRRRPRPGLRAAGRRDRARCRLRRAVACPRVRAARRSRRGIERLARSIRPRSQRSFWVCDASSVAGISASTTASGANTTVSPSRTSSVCKLEVLGEVGAHRASSQHVGGKRHAVTVKPTRGAERVPTEWPHEMPECECRRANAGVRRVLEVAHRGSGLGRRGRPRRTGRRGRGGIGGRRSSRRRSRPRRRAWTAAGRVAIATTPAQVPSQRAPGRRAHEPRYRQPGRSRRSGPSSDRPRHGSRKGRRGSPCRAGSAALWR